MIGYLRGQLIDKGINWLLLDVGGVGYEVLVPARLAEAALLDGQVAVYAHLAVREDALTLYGFVSQEEKRLFELLVGISGIGPKIALSILSAYSPAEVQAAVSQENATVFSAVSGIGKKNAERIILELKNKVWSSTALETTAASGSSQLHQALTALGYSTAEAVVMSKEVDGLLPLDQQIKIALQKQ